VRLANADRERRVNEHRATAAERAIRSLVGNHPPGGIRDISHGEATAINIELTIVASLANDSEFGSRMSGTKAVLWMLATRQGVAGQPGIDLIRSSLIENLIGAVLGSLRRWNVTPRRTAHTRRGGRHHDGAVNSLLGTPAGDGPHSYRHRIGRTSKTA
jgi:hypothetical protein